MQHVAATPAHTPLPVSTPKREAGHGCRRLSACQGGQTLLEFALTSTIVVVMLFVLLQTAMIAVQHYNVSQVARQTARWLAVNIDATDAQVLSQARTYATNLPGLDLSASSSVTASPGCATQTGTPPSCAARSSGDAVSVTVTVPVAPVMFLPTTFGRPPYQISFQNSATTITYTVLLE